MDVVGVPVLEDFAQRHSNSQPRLYAWLAEAEAAEWATPNDIKVRYSSASFLSGNRVVFNIGGNAYRLLVRVNYQSGIVLIERVGTHAEYDRWDLW